MLAQPSVGTQLHGEEQSPSPARSQQGHSAALPPPSPASVLATVTRPASRRTGEECKEWVHTSLPQHNLHEPSSAFHSQVLVFLRGEIQVLHVLADAMVLRERATTGGVVGLHRSSLHLQALSSPVYC